MAMVWKEIGGHSEIITITEVQKISVGDETQHQVIVNLDFEPKKLSYISYENQDSTKCATNVIYDFEKMTGKAIASYEYRGSVGSNGRVEVYDDSVLQNGISRNGKQIVINFSDSIDLGSFLVASIDYPITMLVAG